MENDQGTACGHPPTAVHPDRLVQVVDSSIVVVVVQEDDFTDFGFCVACAPPSLWSRAAQVVARVCFWNCGNHGDVPLQQPTCELVRREEIVACLFEWNQLLVYHHWVVEVRQHRTPLVPDLSYGQIAVVYIIFV